MTRTIDTGVLDKIFPPEERGDWRLEKLNYRSHMIRKVAQAIGEPESFVRECKDGWAFGGSAFRAALQWAAYVEFGIDTAAVEHLPLGVEWREAHRKYVWQTYEDSQRHLAKLGVLELPVVRTMNISRECAAEIGLREDGWLSDATVRLAPLNSFTLQPEMVLDRWGQQFGSMPYDSQVCVTMRATVPASRVWSVPGPGIGAKIDYEVILLGGLFECEAIAHNGRVTVADVW